MTAMQSLAWALLHFVWQGTVVAALAAIVVRKATEFSWAKSVAIAVIAYLITLIITYFIA